MDYIFNFIQQNYEMVVFCSSVTTLLALITLCIQGVKLSKLKTKYERLSNNIEGKNIEEIIYEYYQKIDNLDVRMNKMDSLVEIIERKLLYSIQKVGFVQYNAFDDVGGTLSFTIALLDEQNTGFLLTNIYSRNNSIVYGKTIKNGKSENTLSAEELQALDSAKNKTLDQYKKIAL